MNRGTLGEYSTSRRSSRGQKFSFKIYSIFDSPEFQFSFNYDWSVMYGCYHCFSSLMWHCLMFLRPFFIRAYVSASDPLPQKDRRLLNVAGSVAGLASGKISRIEHYSRWMPDSWIKLGTPGRMFAIQLMLSRTIKKPQYVFLTSSKRWLTSIVLQKLGHKKHKLSDFVVALYIQNYDLWWIILEIDRKRNFETRVFVRCLQNCRKIEQPDPHVSI